MGIMEERACFVDRAVCIGCGSAVLDELSGGSFSDEPLRGILASQAWGENPMPFIAHERWSYVRCRACAQAFHRRILAPAWMERLYARWESQQAMQAFLLANTTPQGTMERGASFVAHALRLYRLAGPVSRERALRVLDYGCGHGEFVAVCRVLGFEAIGIDFAPDRREHGIVERYGSLDDLRAARAHEPAFDAVTLFEVLEHLADPRSVLEQLAQIMRPGATLVLETPDTTGVAGLQSFQDYLAIGPLGHINGFTPATLRAIAERTGFRASRPPVAWVTASWQQLAKRTARHVLSPLLRSRTQQYFTRA